MPTIGQLLRLGEDDNDGVVVAGKPRGVTPGTCPICSERATEGECGVCELPWCAARECRDGHRKRFHPEDEYDDLALAEWKEKR